MVFGTDTRPHEATTLEVFREISVRATQSSALTETLELVAQRICELVAVPACALLLRTDQDLDLHLGAEYRLPTSRTDAMQHRTLSRSTTDDPFLAALSVEKRPIILSSDDDRGASLSAALLWGRVPLVGLPLMFQGRVIGVMVLDRGCDDERWSSQRIAVAATFARLAALAIRHAWMTHKILHRTEVIERQRTTLERLNTAHGRLTDAFVEGLDVDGLVERLVGLVRKPVVVYDNDFNVISWAAPGSLGLKAPPRLSDTTIASPWFVRQAEEMRRKRTSMLLAPSPGVGLMCRRLVCNLQVNGEHLGMVDVVELGQGISVIDVKVSEHAATLLSLQLVTADRAEQALDRARVDLLNELIAGERTSDVVASRARQIGVELDRPHVLLRLARTEDGDDPQAAVQRRKRVSTTIARHVSLTCLAGASVPGADLYWLGAMDSDRPSDLAALNRGIAAAVDSLAAVDMVACGAVSRVCNGPQDYAAAEAETARAVELAQAIGLSGTVVSATDMFLLRLLLDATGGDAATQYAQRILAPIIDYDRQHASSLLETLREFLAHDAKIRATAVALRIHENTVRYRLSKLKDVTALDPENLEDLLNLRLALLLHDATTGPRLAFA